MRAMRFSDSINSAALARRAGRLAAGATPRSRGVEQAGLGLGALLVAVALAVVGAPAHAGRPLVTEDAAVLPAGECSVETYVGRFRADAAPSVRLLSSQLGCDVGRNTQLSVAVARVNPTEGPGQFVTLAGKTSLMRQKEGAEWSVAYGLVLRRSAGLRMPLDQAYVTGVGTLPLAGAWSAHVNLGWTGVHQPHGNTTRWALAVEHAYSDDFHFVAETFGDDHDHRPWVQAGFWAAVTPKVSVNASYGWHAGQDHARALTLGVTVGF